MQDVSRGNTFDSKFSRDIQKVRQNSSFAREGLLRYVLDCTPPFGRQNKEHPSWLNYATSLDNFRKYFDHKENKLPLYLKLVIIDGCFAQVVNFRYTPSEIGPQTNTIRAQLRPIRRWRNLRKRANGKAYLLLQKVGFGPMVRKYRRLLWPRRCVLKQTRPIP